MSEEQDWAQHRIASQVKRGHNRASSAKILTEKGIPFESKSQGVHLIVDGGDRVIDFWPGTGKWIPRGDRQPQFGVRGLVMYIEAGRKPCPGS